MIASMHSIVGKYHFKQGYYNDMIVMLAYMESEGSIDTVELYNKNNHDEEPPTLIADMVI